VSSPIARLKFSMSTSVFFTSLLYTSLPTMGQNGTCSSRCLQQLSLKAGRLGCYLVLLI
jgi:hypothetical protein